MSELLPPGVGVIVRTVAYGAEKEVLAAELKYLLRLWKRILGRAANSKAPSLIHQDIDLLQRIIRDTGIDEVDAILIDMHEGGKEMCFDGYTEQTHQTCKLLVPPPYDDIYIHWLEAHIDYAGGEYEKYNNSISLFNTTYEAYAKYYHRTHKPISEGYVNF